MFLCCKIDSPAARACARVGLKQRTVKQKRKEKVRESCNSEDDQSGPVPVSFNTLAAFLWRVLKKPSGWKVNLYRLGVTAFLTQNLLSVDCGTPNTWKVSNASVQSVPLVSSSQLRPPEGFKSNSQSSGLVWPHLGDVSPNRRDRRDHHGSSRDLHSRPPVAWLPATEWRTSRWRHRGYRNIYLLDPGTQSWRPGCSELWPSYL